MGVHIFNASVTFYSSSENNTPNWMIEGNASELHADGAAGGPTRALVFSANLVDASARIVLRDSKECLGRVFCNLLVEGTVKASGPLNVEVSLTHYLSIFSTYYPSFCLQDTLN